MSFNLIVTTARGMETVAVTELADLLQSLGDPSPDVRQTRIAGLLTAKTSLDPFEVVSKVRDIAAQEPWRFRYLLRFIPIERVVETSLDKIANASSELVHKIEEDDTFRVTVEKRHTQLSSTEIIKVVASGINRKVNLNNPDWIILVEVVGGLTGISVLKPDQIVSTQRV